MADIILNSWFLWAPIALFLLFRDTWRRYVSTYFISVKKYILLEVKIPRDVAKSPQAMESIFAGIHGAARKGNVIDRYWDGSVTPLFSL